MGVRLVNIFSSDLVSITDARCRPQDACCGQEEWSASNDIVMTRRGCFVRRVDRHESLADANSVQFFQKNEPYRVRHPAVGGDDCTSFSFAPEVLADAFAMFRPSAADQPERPFSASHADCPGEALVSLHRIRRIALDAQATGSCVDTLAVDELAMRMLLRIARLTIPRERVAHRSIRSDTRRAHRDLVANTQALMIDRLCERLTLAAIARAVHSSPFHLARVFRRLTGQSLHQYLNRLRLRTALDRLADGATDLTSVAFDLGFSSHSHFTSSFADEFGTTPSTLRREIGGTRRAGTRSSTKLARF